MRKRIFCKAKKKHVQQKIKKHHPWLFKKQHGRNATGNKNIFHTSYFAAAHTLLQVKKKVKNCKEVTCQAMLFVIVYNDGHGISNNPGNTFIKYKPYFFISGICYNINKKYCKGPAANAINKPGSFFIKVACIIVYTDIYKPVPEMLCFFYQGVGKYFICCLVEIAIHFFCLK